MAVKTVQVKVRSDGGPTVQLWSDKEGMDAEAASFVALACLNQVGSQGLLGASFHRPEKDPKPGPHRRGVWKLSADGKVVSEPDWSLWTYPGKPRTPLDGGR